MNKTMIIDATNTILGRLATTAAKHALLGEEVIIINAEKAVVTGAKTQVIDRWKQKYARGVHSKGPFVHRSADRLVRRTVRGMLPYKTSRGADAYKRVMCYVGVPVAYEGKESQAVKGAGVEKLPSAKYVTIQQISRNIGGNQ